MTSISIKKQGGPENIFSCQGGLRGKMFENHCAKGFLQFTKEMVIRGCHIRAIRRVWQCFPSKFCDLVLGFVTDV
jgi:hypothetical protein